MKHTLIFLILILFSNYCWGQDKYSDENESIIFDCIKSKHDSIGIDIISELAMYETALIDKQVLKDATGESFLSIYRQMADNNQFPIDDFYSIENFDNRSLEITKMCFATQFDDLSKKSKVKQLQQRFREVYISGDVSMSNVANTILEIIDSDDYYNPIIRFYSLQNFYVLSKFNSQDSLPVKFSSPDCYDCYKIAIQTTSDQVILIENDTVELTELKNRITTIIDDSGIEELNKFQYDLNIHPDTKMGLMRDIMEIMRETKIKHVNYRTK